MLVDAGLPPQNLAEIITTHPNPHKKNLENVRKPTGNRMGQSSDASKFIKKSLGTIVPEDFAHYMDERSQVVELSTIDREFDVFSRVCTLAIDTWRIHVDKHPMDGVCRPKYYNQRDRRLSPQEETLLLNSARAENQQQAVHLRLEELMCLECSSTDSAMTTYQRKKAIRAIRAQRELEAHSSADIIPIYDTFIQFQLMTGARLSETLNLTWTNIKLPGQEAFLPETKNGRPRKLPLRSDLVAMLNNLPRSDERVFPLSIDKLRGAWRRICERAGLVGEQNYVRIHDLRHEAISRVAEASSNTLGGFSLLDLQHFSGHRDLRMLQRYSHLCSLH